MKIKCIIVDDEPIARKGMKRLVDNYPELELSAMFDTAESALQWLSENEVDLIFLDIEMPGMNGIELAENISPKSMLIFTTAYSEYALGSYEVDAIDYIVKPIRKDRFEKAVSRAMAYYELIHSADENGKDKECLDFIIVKSERKYVRIKLEDILYLEGLKDYVIIHLAEKKVITRMIVKQMEELLPKGMFMRVSKSYIVNKEKIEAFDNNDISICGNEIAIGATYHDAVMNALLK